MKPLSISIFFATRLRIDPLTLLGANDQTQAVTPVTLQRAQHQSRHSPESTHVSRGLHFKRSEDRSQRQDLSSRSRTLEMGRMNANVSKMAIRPDSEIENTYLSIRTLSLWRPLVSPPVSAVPQEEDSQPVLAPANEKFNFPFRT